MEAAPTRRERIERYLWLREPRVRERMSPKLSIFMGSLFALWSAVNIYEVVVEGERSFEPLLLSQLAVALALLCLGAAELLYARRRRLAVPLRIAGSALFLPLTFVLFAAQIYWSWGTWTAALMLVFFSLVLLWVFFVWVRRRIRGGVARS